MLKILACAFLLLPTIAMSDYMTFKTPVAPPFGAREICETYEWACRAGKYQVGLPLSQTIVDINLEVNREINSKDDDVQYGIEDFWTLPDSGDGDCEDYALLKKKRLIEAGIPPGNLILTSVQDLQNNGHAVLIVRTAQGDMVLDNLTNRIRLYTDTGYHYLRSQMIGNTKLWMNINEDTR